MKTIEQIIYSYKSDTLDGRDLNRLSAFLTVDQVESLGFVSDTAKSTHSPKEFTRENILGQLEKDVDFGFEKALDKRGLSAGAMFSVVKMWNWILEEGLEDFPEDDYAQYGLPLFKATALKYGFDNPIGDDAGNEYSYSSEADYE